MPLTIREPRPGDMGWIVQRHGEIYDAEYGWGSAFEGIVAGIVADYMRGHDCAREHCWIAEVEGERAGCIMLAIGDGETAKLRILLVEPRFRGQGVGRELIRTCVDQARAVGFRRIVLWTNSVLRDARRLYVREGFSLLASEPHNLFGEGLVGETWEKAL